MKSAKITSTGMMEPPNGGVKRGRHRSIGMAFEPILTFKKAPILWTRSGLRLNAVFGAPVAIARVASRIR